MAASAVDDGQKVNVTSLHDVAEAKETNKLAGGLFLGGVATIAMAGGFGYSIAAAKKQDPNYFTKGLMASKGIPDSGSALALRALGLGTLYAVTGVGAISLVVWKLIGVHRQWQSKS